jgi:hypothetical protein
MSSSEIASGSLVRIKQYVSERVTNINSKRSTSCWKIYQVCILRTVMFDSAAASFGQETTYFRHIAVGTDEENLDLFNNSRQSVYYTPTEVQSPALPPRPINYIPQRPLDNSELTMRLQACLEQLQAQELLEEEERLLEPQTSPYFSPSMLRLPQERPCAVHQYHRSEPADPEEIVTLLDPQPHTVTVRVEAEDGEGPSHTFLSCETAL